MDFAKRVVPDPVIIRLKRNEESLDNIKQVCMYVCTCVPRQSVNNPPPVFLYDVVLCEMSKQRRQTCGSL